MFWPLLQGDLRHHSVPRVFAQRAIKKCDVVRRSIGIGLQSPCSEQVLPRFFAGFVFIAPHALALGRLKTLKTTVLCALADPPDHLIRRTDPLEPAGPAEHVGVRSALP